MADLEFKQGDRVESLSPTFESALKSALDYRGDCLLTLSNGESLEGYLYNINVDASGRAATLDLFPKNSPRAETVKVSAIQSLVFSGEDTASGKSWEDWMKKKALHNNQDAESLEA